MLSSLKNRSAFTTVTTLAVLCAHVPAQAEYNANITGIVLDVRTYVDGLILFRTNNMPTMSSGCNNTYFVIPGTVPADARAQMLARALTAKSAGEIIGIGYDQNNCPNEYIAVHEVG